MAIWLDLDELAVYIKLPKSTLYKLVQRGEIPGHKVGKVWRFDQDEVDLHIKLGAKKQIQSVGIAEPTNERQANS